MAGRDVFVAASRGTEAPVDFAIRRGLDVPLVGLPEQRVGEHEPVRSVAWLGADTPGLVPEVLVGVGAHVRLGQPVVRDATGFPLVAPGTGVVTEVRRGTGRGLTALVIALDAPGEEAVVDCAVPARVGGTGPDKAREALLASGLWPSLRARPLGRVADPGARPRGIFVTAIDTEPGAPRPDVVLAEVAEDFLRGVSTLTLLTDGAVHVCSAPGVDVPHEEHPRVRRHTFAGPHPAGLAGTHMHLVDPVDRGRTAWHVGYADVAAIGRLFGRGELSFARVVSLCGPRVLRPRLVRARLGASVADLVQGELAPGDCRVVSGSVLSGRQATGWGGHLGRYHRSVSVLVEATARPRRPSWRDALRRRLTRAAAPVVDAALHGRPAPQIPSAVYDRALDFGFPAVPFLRALLVGDQETLEGLGLLELEEEDLALCSYACPSKLDYGPLLRAALERAGGGR